MLETMIRWDHTYQALRDYAETVAELYKDNLYILDHIASGKLVSSIDWYVEMDNGRIEVDLRLEDYWRWIEYDTKPHYPPYSAILDWVKVKFKGNLPGMNGELPSIETLERRMAYFTVKKIGEHGTTGTHGMDDAINQAYEDFSARIEEAISLDIDESVDAIMLAAFAGD